MLLSLAVAQSFSTRVSDEFVVVGNDVLLKCAVPAFASDLAEIIGWTVVEEEEADNEEELEVHSGGPTGNLRRRKICSNKLIN